VLRRHCKDVGRDPGQIQVTHLSTALVARDPEELGAVVDRLRPDNVTAEAMAVRLNAGTIEDHVGRFRGLAEAGVQNAIVNLPDLGDAAPVERFAEVIAAFAG
jgi:alkanesulfonate monooxygenase SsuD/methylene tetrahydromethanopterin reductase-like flavin-dependent oxidoreductase (luciferase family)